MRARWAAILLLIVPGGAAGQQRTASLEVWLHDHGGPRSGAAIAAEREDGLERSTCETREDGRCLMLALAPGRYRVGVVASEADSPTVIIDLAPGDHRQVVLEPASASREAPEALAPAGPADRGLGRDALAGLPIGRTLLDALRLGARTQPSTGNWRLDWAGLDGVRVFVEGVEWPAGRAPGSGLTADLLGALSVLGGSSSPASSARGTAGMIDGVLRSGGVRREAEVSLSYEGSRLDGPSRPFSRYSPWDSDRAERNLTVAPTPWTGLAPSASLGGPLGRGLAFHVSASASHRSRHREVVFIEDPERLPRRFSWFSWSGQAAANVTAAAGPGRRARLALTLGRGRRRGGAPALEPDQATMPDGTATGGMTRSPFLGPVETLARWHDTGADSRRLLLSPSFDWALGSAAALSAHASIALASAWTPPAFRGREIRHEFASSNARVPGVGADDIHPSGYADHRSSEGTLSDASRRVQLSLEGRWSPGRRAAHVLSAGVHAEHLADSVYIGHALPVIRLHWNHALTTPGDLPARGLYGYYTVSRSGTIGEAAGTGVALWVEDRWSPGAGLTLEAGLRAERQAPPSYANEAGVRSPVFGFADMLAPRLSLLWRPDQAGDWRLEASFGTYFDRLGVPLARELFGARHEVRESWTLDTLDWQTLACDEGRRDCPGRFIDRVDARPPWNGLDADISALVAGPATRVDPSLSPMQSVEWGGAAERQLGHRVSVAVRYTGKRLIRAVEDVGIRLPGGGETAVLANPGRGYGALVAPDRPSFPVPRATRRYDGVEFEFRRRSRTATLTARYRFSRLTGNYGGLAAADEGGRESTNLTAAFDSPFSSFDRRGQPLDGPLPGDRPHRLGVDAAVVLPSGTTLAIAGVIESGRPESSRLTFNGVPVFFNGYGDLGRQPSFSQIDLQLRQDVRVGRGRLTVEAAVDNLFDQATALGYFSTSRYRDDLAVPEAAFFENPWDPAEWAHALRADGVRIRDDQLYLVPNRFQRARRVTLTARVRF